jgi:hypothetical protein
MWPVLRPLDEIDAEPLGPLSPRLGDVIAFRPPGEEHVVAHRLLTIHPEGLLTRGDNCVAPDAWLVSPDAVLGRVTSVVRRGRRRRIHGGLLGRCTAGATRARNTACRLAVAVLRRPYHVLARISPLRLQPRVAGFHRPGGTEFELLLGRRSIGRWLPGPKEWAIRAPYRLLVDPRSLPRPVNEATAAEEQDG